jgi:hypothetical protein
LTKKFSISFTNKQSLTKCNWHCFLAVNKGYLAKITKTLAKSFLLLAIHVTYLVFLSITTLPPITSFILFNMLRFSIVLFKEITIRIIILFDLLEFKLLVIVPSPSSKPTKNCSMYVLSCIVKCSELFGKNKFESLLCFGPFTILLLISLSWNAISSDALARTTPLTYKN